MTFILLGTPPSLLFLQSQSHSLEPLLSVRMLQYFFTSFKTFFSVLPIMLFIALHVPGKLSL